MNTGSIDWSLRTGTYRRLHADQFVDLKDLCEQIKTAFNGVRGARRILQACDDIITTLTDRVIKSGCSGFAYQRSYGLSVYFPWSVVCPDYRTLDFAKSSGWGTFLEKVVRETRRPPRFDEGLAAARPSCCRRVDCGIDAGAYRAARIVPGYAGKGFEHCVRALDRHSRSDSIGDILEELAPRQSL